MARRRTQVSIFTLLAAYLGSIFTPAAASPWEGVSPCSDIKRSASHLNTSVDQCLRRAHHGLQRYVGAEAANHAKGCHWREYHLRRTCAQHHTRIRCCWGCRAVGGPIPSCGARESKSNGRQGLSYLYHSLSECVDVWRPVQQAQALS